jgi:hypothetical protein
VPQLRLPTFCLVLGLSACGSWSAAAWENASALPSTPMLQLTFTAPLGSPGEKLAADVAQLNEVLAASLATFTACRTISPTKADGVTSGWGPFADSTSPTVQFTLRHRKEAEGRFEGQLVLKRANEPETEVATSVSTPSTTAVDFDLSRARAFLQPAKALQNADAISIRSMTDGSKRGTAVTLGATRYESSAVPGATELRVATDGGLSRSRWRLDGAGERLVSLADGGQTSQCWDSAFQQLEQGQCALIEGL